MEEYIKEIVEVRCEKKAEEVILVGDFNAHLDSKKGDWIESLGLIDAHGTLGEFNTHYSGERGTGKIDHMLSTLQPSRSGYIEDNMIAEHTDHRPIYATFKVGVKLTKMEAKTTKQEMRSINRKNPEELKKFQAKILKEWTKRDRRGDWEEEVCRSVVRKYRKKLPKRRMELWSPETMANKIWIGVLRRIKASLNKGKGDIGKIIEAGIKRIKRIGKDGEQLWRYLRTIEWTIKIEELPQLWILKRKKELDEDIGRLKKLLQGRRRKEIRESVNLQCLGVGL